MRSRFAASALAAVVATMSALSGCSSPEEDASWDVRAGVCASDGPFELDGVWLSSASCALTVNNQSGFMRAYTIDLSCSTSERTTPFAAGSMLYYVPSGQHTIVSAGIATKATEQYMSCRIRSATVRDLRSDEGSPDPQPAPSGALSDAVAAAEPEPVPDPAESAASAQAKASQSAAASASASASAALSDLQHQALARTYILGDYTLNLTSVVPDGADPNVPRMYISGTVASHSSDTGRSKQFGLVVSLLRADGTLNTRGTLCVQLLDGDSNTFETTTPDGTPDWTSIRITRSPTTPC
ncbi:hypothetical protein ACFQ6B_08345 [Streptomyces wedmorensis]|uniref:Lipoprotein n=1 Tax=Streptomyces wedmorensis TaxID=43759 RepID=A0ABW6J126_STRWE